jgi:hypothetical protein
MTACSLALGKTTCRGWQTTDGLVMLNGVKNPSPFSTV